MDCCEYHVIGSKAGDVSGQGPRLFLISHLSEDSRAMLCYTLASAQVPLHLVGQIYKTE
jgi:hypothetical protein